MRTRLKVILLAFVFFAATSQASATDGLFASGWVLAYENDAYGNVITGDINSLKLAIERGYSIKVAAFSSTSNSNFVHTAKFMNVLLPDGNRLVPLVQIIGEFHSMQFSTGTPPVTNLQEQRFAHTIFRSDGSSQTITYDQNGAVVSNTTGAYAMKWFVNAR